MPYEVYSRKTGKWVSPGRPDILDTASTTARVQGIVLAGTPVGSTPPPLATDLPSLAEINWSSLSPAPRENMNNVLGRMTSNARVVMPEDQFEIIGDSATNQYGVFAPKALGFRGAGIGKSIVQLAPDSYVNQTAPPGSSGNGMIRFGPNNSATRVQTSLSDMTFIGADQHTSAGVQLLYAGLFNYYGQDSLWENLKLLAMSRGGGNSPSTGETFAINSFHDINSRYINIEVDGRNADLSQRIGGSPFGCNGSINVYLQDCYFHDSQFSGLTFSVAGSAASPTHIITTLRVKVSQNANHSPIVSGGRFSGFNHEFVTGAISHTLPDITLDNATLWDTNHMDFGGTNGDNPDILIDSPIWHGIGPTWANGAFVVKMYQDQVTPPAVKNTDGSLKTPVIVTGQNPPHQNIDPLTQYACSVGTGYVAP